MRFIDEVEIHVQAGNGGNGCTSFLREKFKAKGGPDGGDGGKGGDIVLQAHKERNTLLDLHFQKHYRAGSGSHGQGKTRHGRQGKSKTIPVPVGTLVKDAEEGHVLADLTRPGQAFIAATGGKGGRGNARFVTPQRRAPDFSEPGLPGEAKKLRCELKLLADVGIVGLPNAGKSTLISRISSARPKIADYPFTTLVPQLGLVRAGDDQSFVVADIPGILPGAAEGVGMGLKFLRHVERSSVLLFLIDLSDPIREDPCEAYQVLKKELATYATTLMEKQRVLVFNKVDLPAGRARVEDIKRTQASDPSRTCFISALQGEGIDRLLTILSESVFNRQQGKDEGPE